MIKYRGNGAQDRALNEALNEALNTVGADYVQENSWRPSVGCTLSPLPDGKRRPLI